MFDLLVKAYGADPRIRDNAGKTPRQYMVASSQLQGGDMQVMAMSSDTFRQLKDRRRSRRQVSQDIILTISTFRHCIFRKALSHTIAACLSTVQILLLGVTCSLYHDS